MQSRLLGAAAAVVAVFALACQGANAAPRSPNVTASHVVVGAGMTGAYLAAINQHRHGHHWRWYSKHLSPKFGVLTTGGCMALTPMLGAAIVAANEHRELTSREVHVMLADCVVPFIGGWVMEAYFDQLEARQAAAAPAPRRVRITK